MFDVSCPALDHHHVRFRVPLLTLLLCGCPKLWGPCPGGVLNRLSLTDGEMVMGDDTGSDVNWGDVEKLNLEKCTEVRGSIFLSGHVRGLQKFSNIRNITGTIWFFDVRVDPPGLVEIFPALEILGGIDATEAGTGMDLVSGFRAPKTVGLLSLMGLRPKGLRGFEALEEAQRIEVSGEELPGFARLQRVGDLKARGPGRGLGGFPSLQTAGVISLQGLAASEIVFPEAASIASLDIDSCSGMVALNAPHVTGLAQLLVTNNYVLETLSAPLVAEIGGSLWLSSSNVSDLSGLGALSHVGGEVRIVSNFALPQVEIDAFLSHVTVDGGVYACANGEGSLGCP